MGLSITLGNTRIQLRATHNHVERWELKPTLFLGILLAVLFSSCSSSLRFSSVASRTLQTALAAYSELSDQTYLSPSRVELIRYAKSFLGTPYCYGGSNLPCFDCSGYVNMVYRHIGINLPRSSEDIALASQHSKCRTAEARPGDLIFFDTRHAGGVSHIGIVLSSNTFIHASTTRGVVVDQFEKSILSKDILFIASLIDNE